MYMCLYFIHIIESIYTQIQMCVLFQMKLMKKSVINIHTNISYSQRKFKISIKWWTEVICWKIITAQSIYIWNYYLYIYRERERESARKERFGRPIEIFVCPMPPPMPFYSYILTFSFIIQTNLNSQGNAWNHYYPFCFLGCWITLSLFCFCFCFLFFFFSKKLKLISTVLPIC